MKIKICDANKSKIEAALDAVNGKARSFTIQWAHEVIAYVAQAERNLEATKLAKSERRGVTAKITPAGPSAKAYKYAAKSTMITIERGAKDWFLVGVTSTEVYPRQNERVAITITAEQAEIIKAKSVADFVVKTKNSPAEYQPYSEYVAIN